MLVPIKWLKEYVDFDITAEKLSEAMTLTGSNAEGISELGKDIHNVLVGRILDVAVHPNADKLVVCKVDIGDKILQVVTGAPNVKVGQLVPVAIDGALLPGGTRIKSGKLRGELSQGMLCSFQELRLDEYGEIDNGVDGIYVVDQEYLPGTDIKDALELSDEVIEFEITPNRPDCLSMLGIAREAAVTMGTRYRFPEILVKEISEKAEDVVRVIIEEPEMCFRYCARVVRDVKIEPSPRWMRRRLAAAGVRAINNIVDITNYCMLELGQPMHAFDLDKVADRTIIVRKAQKGETLITLDEQKRILTEDMLVIADPEKAIAMAGVMGGLNTEVTGETRDIILESAMFEGGNVRLTSKALGLRSEASSRFEKGIDIVNVERAIDRAAELIVKLGAGTVLEGKVDVSTLPLENRIIKVEWKRINSLLGLELEPCYISSILESLSFKNEIKGDWLEVIVPSFRLDVEGVVDLAEEVARIYGYDKIPMTLMEGSASKAMRTREQTLTDKAKNVLVAMGLFESITYSFVSPRVYEKIGFDIQDYPKSVIISNPLGEDQSAMRTTMIPSLLEVLSKNRNRSADECKIFEIGNVFTVDPENANGLPLEKLSLGIGKYGNRVDFYKLKGQVEVLLDAFGLLKEAEFIVSAHPSLHPGRTAMVKVEDQKLGIIGEVHPDICRNYGLDSGALIAELDFTLLLDIAKTEKYYTHLPKYPSVARDLAIVADKDILAADIETVIHQVGGSLLNEVKLFDIYEGKQIPQGKRSLAYSLSYLSMDRTLQDKDINPIHNKIIDALQTRFNAQLRK
ncbi:MAG: phenylalanine--tRNA ligase subunit beta [Clostridiales bacterium]|nr:phenylalanine--tRNA ligase subunit beta [Clostridiales bacterium]